MSQKIIPLFACLLLCLLCGCGGRPDAGVLLRESLANAGEMAAMESVFESDLQYSAGNTPGRFYQKTETLCLARPLRMRSVQTLSFGGDEEHTAVYTVEEDGAVWFYAQGETGWQKTSVAGIDPAPAAHADLLRLAGLARDQKLVREETLDGARVYKLELLFESEVLRGAVENTIAATGMAAGSRTIVDALLESAPDVYGYCYIDKESGLPVRLEVNATGALNAMFGGIAGGEITVSFSRCIFSASLRAPGADAAFALPPEAAGAAAVEAAG